MELKITVSPEVLAAINGLTAAMLTASSTQAAPAAAASDTNAPEKPKRAKKDAATPAASAPAEPVAAAVEDDDFSVGGTEEAEEVVSFDDIRSLAMALSKKNTGAQVGMRSVFAKHKVQKISELPETAWPAFYKELKAVDKANP